MVRYSAQKEFVKDVATVLVGAVGGVLVDKVVGDALIAMGVPNPQWETIQTHDVALVGAELLGAYYANKKGREKVSKFLVGMASGVVVTDAYEAVAASGNWFSATRPSSKTASMGAMGKYNNPQMPVGKIGGYLSPLGWKYAPR